MLTLLSVLIETWPENVCEIKKRYKKRAVGVNFVSLIVNNW